MVIWSNHQGAAGADARYGCADGALELEMLRCSANQCYEAHGADAVLGLARQIARPALEGEGASAWKKHLERQAARVARSAWDYYGLRGAGTGS